MTADETREQKAMLLLEYQEAEHELSILEEKARRMSERIAAVMQLLEYASRRSSDLNRSEIWVPNTGKRFDISNDPQIRQSFDLDAVLQFVEEIKRARARLDDLSKRKQALGLK